MHASTRAATAALLACLASALAGCAGGPGGETPPRDAEGNYVILLTEDDVFVPAEAKVPKGAVVVWKVQGSHQHDVDVYAPGADLSTASSNQLPPAGYGRLMRDGESFNVTVDQRGTWHAICHTHSHDPGMPAMEGTVHVT